MNYKQQIMAFSGLFASGISAISMIKSGVYKGTYHNTICINY